MARIGGAPRSLDRGCQGRQTRGLPATVNVPRALHRRTSLPRGWTIRQGRKAGNRSATCCASASWLGFHIGESLGLIWSGSGMHDSLSQGTDTVSACSGSFGKASVAGSSGLTSFFGKSLIWLFCFHGGPRPCTGCSKSSETFGSENLDRPNLQSLRPLPGFRWFPCPARPSRSPPVRTRTFNCSARTLSVIPARCVKASRGSHFCNRRQPPLALRSRCAPGTLLSRRASIRAHPFIALARLRCPARSVRSVRGRSSGLRTQLRWASRRCRRCSCAPVLPLFLASSSSAQTCPSSPSSSTRSRLSVRVRVHRQVLCTPPAQITVGYVQLQHRFLG